MLALFTSRIAVLGHAWRSIYGLSQGGWGIEAAPRSGARSYCLSPSCKDGVYK